MDGHHPHAGAGLAELALDLDRCAPASRRRTPAATAGPTARAAGRESRNSATTSSTSPPEPGMEAPEPAFGIKHVGIELVGPLEIEPAAPGREPLIGLGDAGNGALAPWPPTELAVRAPWARANRSSSLTSNSGERNSAASVRSSPGLSSTSPSASRSRVAMWLADTRAGRRRASAGRAFSAPG